MKQTPIKSTSKSILNNISAYGYCENNFDLESLKDLEKNINKEKVNLKIKTNNEINSNSHTI